MQYVIIKLSKFFIKFMDTSGCESLVACASPFIGQSEICLLVKPFIEKIINLSKKDNLANRRLAQSIIGNQESVAKLFKEIGPRVSSRNGGYTRILKYGFRVGDKAPMAYMELVDRIQVEEKAEQIAKS